MRHPMRRRERTDHMTTKLPSNENSVTRNRPRRPVRRDERGIALISVIAVLVLLAMVATPFLLTMRDSAARGEKFLYGQRADAEAEALFETVRSQLVGGLEHVERRKLDAKATAGTGAATDSDATPDCDTPDEFAMPQSVLDRFNRANSKEHRVWSADVVDAQTLFNLNNCSYPVLANILGRTEVASPATSDKLSITLTHVPDSFPKTDGVVRIGSECVHYKTIVGNDLVNCERGYLQANACNGPAHDLVAGEVVIPESCFQIATRPFRLRAPAWVRYTHVDQARTISDLGVAPLPPEDFERIRPYVTAWNGNAVGDGWCNPQTVKNAISAHEKQNLYAQVKNPRFFGPGTMVMITDGVNSDYAVVTRLKDPNNVLLAGDPGHDYAADQTRIYCLARSPINVNTADVSTLALVFDGLRLHVGNNAPQASVVSQKTALDLAVFLKTWKGKPVAGEPASSVPDKPGVFRNWEDFSRAIQDAQNAGRLDAQQKQAVLLNAMNANDSQLEFSTVPFVFRSYDIYEVRATASIQGAQGRELARREVRRVMEVSTTRSGTFVIETQDEFQNQIIKSRDGKYMMTYPVSVAQFDKLHPLNIPPSEYESFATQNLYPSTDRTVGVGNVQLAPGSFRFGTTNNRIDHVVHFDTERIPDGKELKDAAYTMSVDAPYAPEATKGPPTLDLIDKTDVPGVADQVELGLREFACSFWYRPEWDRGAADQIIFDYGLDTDEMNRVSLRYDGKKDALVLAVDGATREKNACEVVYRFDHGTWLSKQWYHLACHVHGCSPELMELFVDGDKVGESSTQTRLQSNVVGVAGSGGGTFQLQVTSDKDFPDGPGCLIVRGKEGVELMEYSSHSDNSFTVTRRKARTIVHAPVDATPRTHNPGDTAQLYGFSGPLLCDVKKGGATLVGSLGAWRVFRFICTGDTLEIPGKSGSPPIPITRGMANPATTSQTAPVVTLQDWDTGSTDTTVYNDLGSTGTEGIAMIVSAVYDAKTGTEIASTPKPTYDTAGDPQSQAVGGIEFVNYVVGPSTGQVTITPTKRNLQLRHLSTNDIGNLSASSTGHRFMPTYSYGSTDAAEIGAKTLDNSNGGDTTNKGAMTAFIPIAVVVNANNAQYVDPMDGEPQLRYRTIPFLGQTVVASKAYIQIDGEWCAYDVFDQNLQGSILTTNHKAFYRDMTIPQVAAVSGSNITPFQGASNTLTALPIVVASSYGVPGGSGGNASGSDPMPIVDKNNESDAPYVASQTGQGTALNPPVTALQIAQALEFRGYENRNAQQEFRIANTIPPSTAKIHAIGATVYPTFAVVTGDSLEQAGTASANDDGARYAAPGYNDLVTLRDRNGNDEEMRLQWGFLQHDTYGYKGWAGPSSSPVQAWGWDRPNGVDGINALRRWDSRAFTRLLKFPCGEPPDGAVTKGRQDVSFGKKYDGSGALTKGTYDEIWVNSTFKRAQKDRPDYAFLGVVPAAVGDPSSVQQQAPSGSNTTTTNLPSFVGIDASTDEIDVHMPFLDQSYVFHPFGLPIDANTYSSAGGVIKIDDELILFQQFDASSGKFTGCKRGAFNTTPATHEYEAYVAPICAFPCSQITAGIDLTSGSYELKDATDFPDAGYLRVGLGSEIIGYTDWDVNNHLSAPLGRIDNSATARGSTNQGKQVGGAIFRGRFGTIAQTYNSGDVAIAMPFRVDDRYAEHADDPEQSYLQCSWTKHGAVYKRITWDAEPIKNVEIVALIRFSGGPAWDSDKIIHVGQDTMPGEDRRQYLYQITDAKAENLLNVEADRVEVRLGVRFDKGAYDRLATLAPDEWKQTPQIRKVTVEYVAPPQVLTQE